MKNNIIFGSLLCSLLYLGSCINRNTEKVSPQTNPLTTIINNNEGLSAGALVGKKIFFDDQLSSPAGQSCASCHSPISGFADPLGSVVSPGAVQGLAGTRNSPAIGYAQFAPALYYDAVDETYVGGYFLDGRANSLEEQATKPFFNHVEMNNADLAALIAKIKNSSYASLFTKVYGEDAFSTDSIALKFTTQALASYERSIQVSQFTSKFDYYLADRVELTDQELSGLALFNDPDKGNCAACHPSTIDPTAGVVLFTDNTYDNIGLPVNPKIATIGIDLGLGKTVNDPNFNGFFKVPSLRNVALTAPYFHNGAFTTLQDAIRFYSQRDIPGVFPAPEIPQTMNTTELGNLKLTNEEIEDIAAFLGTLSDGYFK